MRPHRCRDADRGSSAVELVVLAPVLMFAVFLIVQAALYMHARHVALAAAQQGARIARTTDLTTGAGLDAAQTDTLGYLRQLGGNVVTSPTVAVSRDTRTATVVVHVDAVSILPGLHLAVTERSSGPLETFTTDAAGFPSSDAGTAASPGGGGR